MANHNRHFVVYDLETSGVDFKKGCEIIQIGAAIIKYQNYEISDTFEILLKPQRPECAQERAIEVIGKDLWERSLSEGLHPKTGLNKFKKYIESFNPTGKFWTAPIRCGYNNGSFDDRFLEYAMDEYKLINQKKDDKPWAYFSIDVLPLMFTAFHKQKMKNHKLDSFLELLNIEKRSSDVHDGCEDALKTAQMLRRYLIFMGKIRSKIVIKDENKETAKV